MEQCYLLKNQFDRENNRIESRKMNEIAERAKEYISELQKLLDLNFENPNEELRIFAQNNKMDLKDPKIKKHFLDVRKKYLEDINKFYERNFLTFNQKMNNNKANINGNKKIFNKKLKNDTNGKEVSNNINEIGKGKAREFLVEKKNDEWKLENIKDYLSLNMLVGILFLVMVFILIRY